MRTVCWQVWWRVVHVCQRPWLQHDTSHLLLDLQHSGIVRSPDPLIFVPSVEQTVLCILSSTFSYNWESMRGELWIGTWLSQRGEDYGNTMIPTLTYIYFIPTLTYRNGKEWCHPKSPTGSGKVIFHFMVQNDTKFIYGWKLNNQQKNWFHVFWVF